MSQTVKVTPGNVLCATLIALVGGIVSRELFWFSSVHGMVMVIITILASLGTFVIVPWMERMLGEA